jgi:hypothetical protein
VSQRDKATLRAVNLESFKEEIIKQKMKRIVLVEEN